MAYENQNGEEIATTEIDVNEVMCLFYEATNQLLMGNVDIYQIMAKLEYDVITCYPKKDTLEG